ncbi:MAG: FkbM family methyltransferase [Pseudomonadota bacterium]
MSDDAKEPLTADAAPLLDMPMRRAKRGRHGVFLYLKSDVHVGRSLDVYGEYSEGEIEIFRQLTPEGGVVVDVGANLGTHTVWFAKQVGPRGRVYAYEPQRLLFQTVCANVALNDLNNVIALPAAAGSAPGRGVMPEIDPTRPSNTGVLTLSAYAPGVAVEIIPIDQLGLTDLHFLKIDVEGMELETLKGASYTLRYRRPTLYVENTTDRPGYTPEQSHELVNFILDAGYRAYWHWPPVFNAANHYGEPRNIFGHQAEDGTVRPIISCNMLCLPNEHTVKVESLLPVERDDDPQAAFKRAAERSSPEKPKKTRKKAAD